MKDRNFHGTTGKKSLIVGAGHSGAMLARELLRGSGSSCDPVLFVDDDPTKQGREVHGIQ